MTIIEQFLNHYQREYNFYREIAHLCAQQCEIFLESSGIRSIVTHRAKRPDRLEKKVTERAKEKSYQSVEDIYLDIVDLAGVRISLYFPEEIKHTQRLIQATFVVDHHKTFAGQKNQTTPYQNRFAGYCAEHSLVRLREETLAKASHLYTSSHIEIQVASVLMHAWAEVEHDLIYKPLTGEISDDEYAILDEINGLVTTGEVALARLQKAVERRVSGQQKEFSNHYELASYLYDIIPPTLKEEDTDPFMGRTDILFPFLKMVGMATPVELSQFTKDLSPYLEDRPVAEQLIDRILESNPNFYEAYNQAREVTENRTPFKVSTHAQTPRIDEEYHHAMGYFLSRWIVFEQIIKGLAKLIHPNEPLKWRLLGETIPYLGFDLSRLDQIEEIRSIRNKLVHGHKFHDSETLIRYAKVLDQLLSNMRDRAQGDAKRVIDNLGVDLDSDYNIETTSALWALRERGVQLRNKIITIEEFPQWDSEFEMWHSHLLREAEKVSNELKAWLKTLNTVKQWDLMPWVNEEHHRKMNIVSEILDRLEKYLTRGMK